MSYTLYTNCYHQSDRNTPAKAWWGVTVVTNQTEQKHSEYIGVEKTPIRSKMQAVVEALWLVPNKEEVTIVTDLKCLISILNDLEKTTTNNYANKDLWDMIYDLADVKELKIRAKYPDDSYDKSMLADIVFMIRSKFNIK